MMRGCIGAFGRFRLPRNATKVGKNGALQRVEPAKTSRRDNGVRRRVEHGGFSNADVMGRELMAWLRRLGAGGPRCRTRVL
jgi:hypothetical protein